MASPEPKSGGLVDSVKRVGEGILALLHNRLQLLSVELQEEKHRVLQAGLWLCIGVMLIFLGLAMGVGAVALVVHCWWGLAGLFGLALLLLLVGAVVLAVMWNRLKSSGAPFSGTLEELKKDREWLRGKH
ncbi:MAG: phage holin family protein [Verrucomicrobia bacterium]|jgi:uncharacterized membrane protein YqjE|nr:phage holin family protein [Verrucomicrobiota bacterium]